MSTSKSAASRKGGGASAAKAERNGKRTMDFEGLEVALPAKLPGSFSYRFAKITRMEESQQLASGELYALVVKIIGEEQFDKVADHVDETDSETGLVDFLLQVLSQYGLEAGESQASASS
jgi:hypothetical protein